MALGVELRQSMSQSMVLAPQLRQSLNLLSMCLPDLRAELYRELEKNVLVDDIEQSLSREPDTARERRRDEVEDAAIADDENEARADFDVRDGDVPFDDDDADDGDSDDYGYDDNGDEVRQRDESAADGFRTMSEDDIERRQRVFDNQTEDETLEEHLTKQLPLSDIDAKDLPLAEMLVGELDDNGYFNGSIPDLIMVSGQSEAKIRELLAKITELDPPGCGATSPEQCFLAQIDKLDGSPYQQEVRELLEHHHLRDIAEGRITAVTKDLGVSLERYRDIIEALRTLEPFPGRAYAQGGKSVAYVNPEVRAVKRDGRWIAVVDDRSFPDIHISSRYLRMLEDPNTSKEVKDYIRARMTAIEELREAMERRQETITNISQAIFDAQPGFFEKGLIGLRPLKMQEIADKVGVHHTTVSRTVNDKYALTPKGVVELRKFFTHGFTTDSGEQVTKDAVAEKLHMIIEKEDKTNPLSDERISKMLEAEGLKVARRTVAKYRLRLGIPGVTERRKL